MPFKLIGIIITLVLVTVFCGFNLENKCNINLIFHNFENISVFLALMVSFLAGILVTLPFTLFKKKMTKEQILQASEKLIASENKSAAKAEKQKVRKEEKSRQLAEKAKKESEKSASRSEEKTIFDFKIKRPVKEIKNENSVPKINSQEKTEKQENKNE